MPQFDLNSFLPYRLNVLAHRISREFAAHYSAAYGISIAEWRVVAHLHHGGPVSVREITDRVNMEKSRVSRAASRLEQAGYLRKRPNPDDRRLLVLELTEQGQDMMVELAKLATEFEAQVLANLGDGAGQFQASVERLLSDET